MNKGFKVIKPVIVFMSLAVVTGCISQKRLEYIKSDSQGPTSYTASIPESNVIKPGDELYIRVSSFDDVQYNFFSTQSENRQMNFSNDVSVSLISYDVNDSGYLNFPVLGYVSLGGLTIESATEKLKTMLSEYTNQPTVLIKLVNKRISILGEVARPGHYVYTKNRLMIFEALSLAGDITLFGDKRKVYIIREEDNTVQKIPIDLTSDSMVSGKEFFLKQNDVLYVPPTGSKTWSLESVPWNLVLTSISTLILVLSFLNIF